MPRALAFDIGKKRIGIAATDELQMIASGLKTVAPNEVFAFVSDYLDRENVEVFVLGDPRHLDNTEAESMPLVDQFEKSLNKRHPQVRIDRVDERFTSVMASRAMLEMGMKKKDRKNKANVDEISAVLILQSWLDQQSRCS
ncbi:MAG: Holliday junction resolvase RuvX [Flavobacteriales bacterium]|nr:Holliday junction resolvase RuvX [Flavobacteriales bacterium]